jgi:thiol-disulfide isomerase/thioredoxin
MTEHKPSPVESGVHSEPVARRTLLVGVAGAAALAGVGVAIWRQPQDHVTLVQEPVPGFWAYHWESPDGVSVALKSFQGRPLLLNFWATWCPPCVEELPLINQFYLDNKVRGWQVLGVAIDKKEPVQKFLRATPLSFPVALAGLAGTELGRGLGNLTGSLPFTVALAADGSVALRKLGRVLPADLAGLAALK